jgi:hypothetical protein
VADYPLAHLLFLESNRAETQITYSYEEYLTIMSKMKQVITDHIIFSPFTFFVVSRGKTDHAQRKKIYFQKYVSQWEASIRNKISDH